jgi:hypothetical protein
MPLFMSRKHNYLTVFRAVVDVLASTTSLRLPDHFMADRTKWLRIGGDRRMDGHEVFENKRLTKILGYA